MELKNKCEAIERREAERRAVDERKRKEEIDFLKPLDFRSIFGRFRSIFGGFSEIFGGFLDTPVSFLYRITSVKVHYILVYTFTDLGVRPLIL